jgi:predicted outer membrane protein
MYKKIAVLTACMAAVALLLAVSSAQAADEGGEGGGSTASAAEMPDICKAQAAKRNLTGSEAEEYLKQCAAPIGDAERSAAPADRLEGQL